MVMHSKEALVMPTSEAAQGIQLAIQGIIPYLDLPIPHSLLAQALCQFLELSFIEAQNLP